ncbi:Peptidase family S41 [Micromonospora viridifaciens]|uniref:Peptidase family S41 n=1 Tax=Micromonospora viridifaciens TaxID=1881 RepID=A0A1C4YBP0_MICVI|nr:S41 family peptidase [Micromonospora viridifaciens]SCF18172.1 Peptidase family S41 [Micromonospora viridifaciens]
MPAKLPVDVLAAQQGTDLAAVPAPRRVSRESAPGAEPALDGGQRLQVIDALACVIEGAYCHLPQKRAGYAVDPVQALQLLRRRCVDMTDGEFHMALTGLITGLRDAHTRYRGPATVRGSVAALPFLIECHGPDNRPTFLVSKLAANSGIRKKTFVPGVELLHWNAIPFARAVDIYADRETGGRPDARRARALESLTFRALDYGPPPDEQWVIVGFRTLDGDDDEVRVPWRRIEPGKAGTAMQPGSGVRFKVAADPAREAVRRAKKLMFAPALWQADQARTPIRAGDWLPTELQDTLAARPITTRRGELGYLRIWSFDVDDHEAFIAEAIRLLAQLPDRGLIIDLRGNPGGLIWAAERLLQLFTPNTIVPTRFALLASPLTRAMAASPFNRLEFEAWTASLDNAIATGDLYSQPLPLTDPHWCNDIGQRYTGPVLAVADPNTYSSGDLFAAGFLDNRIGPLVTVGQATGAGGANVWSDRLLRDALAGTPYAFPPLPAGVGFTLAIRRAIRSGPADGIPIEDTGIPGIPYTITRRDLLEDNSDLHDFCADLLAGQQS